MSDISVRAALRSDAPLVVVEAPAGCGKTHQGAEYARDVAVADAASRPLILTHTHAACSVFADRTRGMGNRVDICTIDSVVAQIATAYHLGLGLPPDTAAWVRQQPKDRGYGELCLKVARLLKSHPVIARSMAQRHRTVICDEHQDATGDQHAIVSALLQHGARLRIFADPMQRIFNEKSLKGSSPAWNWDALKGTADAVDELDHPHRWENGCAELGAWTLNARRILRTGGSIDLTKDLPPSVKIVFADNQAKDTWGYQLQREAARPIYAFEKTQPSLLILTHYNATARSLCAFLGRRIPLWEGHTRTALEKLVTTMTEKNGDKDAIAAAVVQFMKDTGKGFSASAFGDRFQREVSEGCIKPTKGKPAGIQELARFVVSEPDHRGVAKMLRRLAALKDTDAAFTEIKTDCHREFWDTIRLGGFEAADSGFAEITHRRTHIRPKPPARAISNIHKAKGLECDSVIVLPCDARSFPNKHDARCLLYVAISRAKKRLMLVISRANPTPLFTV